MVLENITNKIYKTTGKDEVREAVSKTKHGKVATQDQILKNALPTKKINVRV